MIRFAASQESVCSSAAVGAERLLAICGILLMLVVSGACSKAMGGNFAIDPDGAWHRNATRLSDSSTTRAHPTDRWRAPQACAVNCLYALLRHHDIGADYYALSRSLLLERPGYEPSLLEIRDEAYRNGLRLHILKMTPQDLAVVTCPLILHLEVAEMRSSGSGGHFVVLLEYSDTVVRYMDGSSALVVPMRTGEFLRRWTGFVLAPESSLALNTVEWVAVALSAAAGASLFWMTSTSNVFRRLRRRRLTGDARQSEIPLLP